MGRAQPSTRRKRLLEDLVISKKSLINNYIKYALDSMHLRPVRPMKAHMVRRPLESPGKLREVHRG